MIGLGTIINCAAILAGGIFGLLFGRFLNKDIQDSLTKACGVSTIFIANCRVHTILVHTTIFYFSGI